MEIKSLSLSLDKYIFLSLTSVISEWCWSDEPCGGWNEDFWKNTFDEQPICIQVISHYIMFPFLNIFQFSISSSPGVPMLLLSDENVSININNKNRNLNSDFILDK